MTTRILIGDVRDRLRDRLRDLPAAPARSAWWPSGWAATRS